MNMIHSLLFVPGREKMLEKIPASSADAHIIDLEDSISQDEKEFALDATIHFLENHVTENCFIRVDRLLMREQLLRLKKCQFRGVMVPKVEDCGFLDECADSLANRAVIALVETPMGLSKIESIASYPGIMALAFGAEDYTAATNMQNSEEVLLFLKSRLVMFGKAYGKKVYDTPSFCIQDVGRADAEAEHSAQLGFDGKMAIHPKLIPGIRKAFSAYDMESIRKIVNQYESQNEAILVIDGKVYEKMHIARFKRILREHNNNGNK